MQQQQPVTLVTPGTPVTLVTPVNPVTLVTLVRGWGGVQVCERVYLFVCNKVCLTPRRDLALLW